MKFIQNKMKLLYSGAIQNGPTVMDIIKMKTFSSVLELRSTAIHML